MAESKNDSWHELRKAFPKEVVGKLPKGGIQLDFVGHAAVTDRLLSVDPEWHWEPLGVDERGLPALDKEGNLWIQLTVCGVTRIGVGDGRNMKERIGDALRNAAMRFGVALDLWTKDELESTLEDPTLKNNKPAAKSAPAKTPEEHVRTEFPDAESAFARRDGKPIKPAQSARIYKLGRQLGIAQAALEARVAQLQTEDEAEEAIKKLEAQLEGGEAA